MYAVEFLPVAKDDLTALDKPIAQRVLKKIHWLAENFEHIPRQPLTGNWQGYFKLRVGDYRIIYTTSEPPATIIFIHLIKHRREVYKL